MKDSFGDRFIPTRSKAVWHINFDVTPVSCSAVYIIKCVLI